jgi:hypothetical protein
VELIIFKDASAPCHNFYSGVKVVLQDYFICFTNFYKVIDLSGLAADFESSCRCVKIILEQISNPDLVYYLSRAQPELIEYFPYF